MTATLRPLTLLESADLLGRYHHVELALFAGLGERSLHCEQAETAILLEGASQAHAFRASIFADRLPVSVGLPSREILSRSPGSAFHEAIGVLLAEGEDVALVAALAQAVYPLMASGYESHLARCSPAADPPIARAIHRALDDLERIRNEVDPTVAGLAPRVDDRTRSVAQILGPSGVFGPLRQVLVT